VIEMRELAERNPPAARTSLATMDLVLSVGSVNAPLAGPLALQLPRPPKRSLVGAWRAIAVTAGLLTLALVLHWWRASVVSEMAPDAGVAAEVSVPEVIAPETTQDVVAQVSAPVVPDEPTSSPPPIAPGRRTTRTPMRAPSAVVPVASNVAPSSIDDLMHRASDAPAVLPASTSAPAPSNVATTPTREQVRTALAAMAPAVQACTAGGHGLATVSVVFHGASGAVRSAVVTGAYAGTPEGSCIARAVREAQVPSFSQNTFTVTYPFAT
jgi:hypothetical protein